MSIRIPCGGLPLSAFAMALLLGAAPSAYAQCEAGAGGTMVKDMAQTQPGAGQETGAAAEQSETAMADSEIETDQGGVTTDEEGAATAQSGGNVQESDVTAADAGAMTESITPSAEESAAMDSPEIEGADEERVVAMLEEQGYSDVSSVVSCGAYYAVEAMEGGEQAKLQVDIATGRVNRL